MDNLRTVHLRGMPEGLIRVLKVRAASEGKTLRDLCIEILIGMGKPVTVPMRTLERFPVRSVADADAAEPTATTEHAANCRCLICKPPK
jgi:plasmid stability protein